MRWPAWLRAVGYLRRVTRALESIDRSLAAIAEIYSAREIRDHPPRRKSSVSIDTIDQVQIDKRWRDEQVAMGREVD